MYETTTTEIKKTQLFYNKKHDVFITLCIKERNEIEIQAFKQYKLESIFSNIEQYFSLDVNDYHQNIIENSCFTNLDLMFVTYFNNDFYLIDIFTKNLILKKNFSTLSPLTFVYGQFKYLNPIEETNDILVLNKANRLVYITYKNNDLKFDTIQNIDLSTEISLNKNILCSYNELENELLVIRMGFSISKEDDFSDSKTPLIKIKFKNSINSKFLITSEYLATLENEIILCLYRISDGKKIATLPLYYKAVDFFATNDYVVLKMKDQKFISFLIVDPEKSNDVEKIGQLYSR